MGTYTETILLLETSKTPEINVTAVSGKLHHCNNFHSENYYMTLKIITRMVTSRGELQDRFCSLEMPKTPKIVTTGDYLICMCVIILCHETYYIVTKIITSLVVRASEIETRVRVRAPGDGFGAKPRFFWRRRRDFPP